MNINDQLLKQYRNWLLQFNDLRDIGHMGEDGGRYSLLTNDELKWFRNNPKESFLETDVGLAFPRKLFRPNKVTLDDLAYHIITQKRRTLFISNAAKSEQLLMLADIDADNDLAASQLAQDASREVLGGRTYIEPSTHGIGRHVYFLLDVTGFKRQTVWDAFDQYADLSRCHLGARDGAHLCGWYGLPTLWDKSGERYNVLKRGNLLRLPYLPDGEASLEELRSLKPLPFAALNQFLRTKASTAINRYLLPKGDIGRTNTSTSSKTEDNSGNGETKRTACVTRNLRASDGQCTLDEVLTDYHANYSPTGMTAKDVGTRRKKMKSKLDHFKRTFKPSERQSHPFKKDEYLSAVLAQVPLSAFHWPRREKLTHQRLADFISIKLQDAFFVKPHEWFGQASRDATIQNMRSMKAKGLVDWVVTTNTYKKLLDIAVEFHFLHIYCPHIPPTFVAEGMKIVKKRGQARLIGPGTALKEEHDKFMAIYSADQRMTKIA